jgi:hypothetical protein
MFDVVEASEHRPDLERLRSEVLAEVPDALLEEDFSELHRLMELLEAQRLRRLAEIERRGGTSETATCRSPPGSPIAFAWVRERPEASAGPPGPSSRCPRRGRPSNGAR